MRTRNFGLDFLKILASLGVVTLHVSSRSEDFGLSDSFTLTSFFYYLGTISIPIFFALNGYFLCKKTEITWNYIIKKVIQIFTLSFFWCLLIWIVGRNFNENLLEKIFLSFLQQGYFYQFWFFGSLFLLYLLSPFIQKINKKSELLFLLIIISESLMIVSAFLGKAIQSEVIQTFRLWTWLNYFLLGACLDKWSSSEILKRYREKLPAFMLALLVCLPFYIYSLSKLINNYYAEYYYDTLYVKILVIILLVYFSEMKFSQQQTKVLRGLSGLTMGVFIVHTYVLRLFDSLLFLKNPYLNIVGIFLVYILSGVLTYIMKKSKIMKKLLEL